MSRRNNHGTNKGKGNSNGKKDYSTNRTGNSTNERSSNSSGSSNNTASNDAGAEEGRKETNDVEWYNHDERLTKDGAQIPFNLPFGARLQYFGKNPNVTVPGGFTVNSNTYRDYAVPGSLAIALKPSYGINTAKTSPLNVAANALYTEVRHVNNGRKNYDPADLMMYALVWGDIYSFITWVIRLYDYAFMYSQRNWYIGKTLIQLNGVNAESLVRNLANFRYWINSMINKVSSFAVPKTIDFFKRRVFLYQNCYIENQFGNLKDQTYQFVPAGFMRFDLDVRNVGKLKYEPLPFTVGGTLMDFTTLQNYFNTLMQNITGDEDFGLMSGDILRAYGLEGIIGLQQVPETPEFSLVYDPFVLSQFKNAYIVGNLYTGSTHTYIDHNNDAHVFGDVEQTTDGLLMSLESEDWSTHYYDAYYAVMDKPLSVENPDPGVGDVLESTRLMPFYATYINGVEAWGCGTEIACEMRAAVEPETDRFHDPIEKYDGVMTVVKPDSQNVPYINAKVAKVSAAFKYHPNMYFIDVTATNPGITLNDLQLLSNVDNVTLVTNDNIQRIHEIALLSLFFVPGVAKLLS